MSAHEDNADALDIGFVFQAAEYPTPTASKVVAYAQIAIRLTGGRGWRCGTDMLESSAFLAVRISGWALTCC